MGEALTVIAGAAPAIAMLAAIACAIGGGHLIATRRDRTKGILLIVMGVVLLFNLAIWTA